MIIDCFDSAARVTSRLRATLRILIKTPILSLILKNRVFISFKPILYNYGVHKRPKSRYEFDSFLKNNSLI